MIEDELKMKAHDGLISFLQELFPPTDISDNTPPILPANVSEHFGEDGYSIFISPQQPIFQAEVDQEKHLLE